ncbi:MAG: hypothetical protein H0U66_13135 [Gemmatimonadaceae bacterium]|nr:hypothetical protein [Gemmatimonadaceae bacterium]
MSSYEAPNEPPVARPPYRPPVGVPERRDTKWAGAISLFLHALLIALMILPILLVKNAEDATRGAGGAGAAGGGGGGSRGGAREPYVHEDLRYVQVAPPPPPAPPVLAKPNSLIPPVATPIPPPKPVMPPPTVPPPTAAAPEIKPDSVTVAAGNAPGAGNGAGATGGPGAGPGTGGGTGTGVGAGRGSGVGPGNGGGEGNIFPPTADLLLLPELPVPGALRGKTFVIHFEIDETGRVARVDIDTGNSGYDRRLRDRFMQFKWRPAHRVDGTPVAAGVDIPLSL